MSQNVSANNIYKEWLDKAVQDDFIRCFSRNDLILNSMLIGLGGFGVVRKAVLNHSKLPVALKTLIRDHYECEEELYKKFINEVSCLSVLYAATKSFQSVWMNII